MADLLRQSGARITEVRIRKLESETFYATVEITSGRNRRSVDARPSDAVALALVEGIPIRVDAEVFTANEARPEVGDAADKWQGAGTLGAKEIVAEVVARWRSAEQRRGSG
jgi:bifunctional DNase/RNase